jgi:hypothetical protein
LFLSACTGRREEAPVIPPVTSVLTRQYIGFGVINASFTHVTAEPADGSLPLGYLRRGTLVQIIRRQILRTNTGFSTWVFIEGSQYTRGERGWLREDVMSIFESENRARTASELIAR